MILDAASDMQQSLKNGYQLSGKNCSVTGNSLFDPEIQCKVRTSANEKPGVLHDSDENKLARPAEKNGSRHGNEIIAQHK